MVRYVLAHEQVSHLPKALHHEKNILIELIEMCLCIIFCGLVQMRYQYGCAYWRLVVNSAVWLDNNFESNFGTLYNRLQIYRHQSYDKRDKVVF